MAQVLFLNIFFEKDSHLNAVEELMRQPFYTTFLSNNCTSFDLWLKDNLIKHQKVSKYYEDDCLHFFVCLFVFVGFFVLFMLLLLKTVIFRLEFISSF